MNPSDLPAGLHERLVTRELRTALIGVRAIVETVDPAEQAGVLSDFVAQRLAQVLEDAKPELRAGITNQLLALLEPHDEVDEGARGPEQLIAIATPEAPGVWGIKDLRRPKTPLTRPALLTNSPSDPKLGFELREEIASADRVDLLCAFIKWYGLRVLEDDLRALTQRGKPLRVLTTTYLGATDRSALDRLVNDLGAQVRVNYETRSTRLHAKAWLLRRASGYDTAYVGSSNLSRAALLDGLEWNVRLSGAHRPHLLHKLGATFAQSSRTSISSGRRDLSSMASLCGARHPGRVLQQVVKLVLVEVGLARAQGPHRAHDLPDVMPVHERRPPARLPVAEVDPGVLVHAQPGHHECQPLRGPQDAEYDDAVGRRGTAMHGWSGATADTRGRRSSAWACACPWAHPGT